MNFDFSEAQDELKRQLRRFFVEKRSLALVRRMLDGAGDSEAANLWRDVSALGWPAAAVPEKFGGHELGYVTLCAIAEEAGRACAPLPFLASIYLAAEALLIAGAEAQKRRWLPPLASGALIGTGFLDRRPAASLPLSESQGRISGTILPVPSGMVAHIAVLTARAPGGGSSLYLADLASPGVSRRRLATIDGSIGHAALHFEAVAAEPLGAAGDGARLVAILQARAAVLIAFEQVGGADACLQMALDYARERRSFGRVIGSYQAIKHRLAEIYINNELARSNAYYGAWALQSGAPELQLAAAAARVSATEAYEFAASENIQIHGGIGFTWEADPQLHYRRARVLALAAGTTAEWQQRLVAELDRVQD